MSYTAYTAGTGSFALDYLNSLYSGIGTWPDRMSFLGGVANDFSITTQIGGHFGALPLSESRLGQIDFAFQSFAHLTALGEASFRFIEGDTAGAAISFAANEAGILAGGITANVATSLAARLLQFGAISTPFGVATGLFVGSAVTFSVGNLLIQSYNSDFHPSGAGFIPNLDASNPLAFPRPGTADFNGDGSVNLLSFERLPVFQGLQFYYPQWDALLPQIDRGTASSGYDSPWGNAPGRWGQGLNLPTFASDPRFISPAYYPPTSNAPTSNPAPTQPVIDPSAEPLPDIDIPAAPSGFDDPWNWLFGSGSFFDDVSSFFDSIFNLGSITTFYDWPVVLDLDGNGVTITPKESSNVFFDMAGDGYQHRTAWAGAGDAVLAFDADSDGKITQKNEIVFTEWDPTATSDMQALRDVFDTNHNGKLDAGDAKFSQFKLIVVNSDGTQTVRTLAQAGVASIGLVENLVTRTFDDGSAIDGQTIFTRTDGTTGTAAAVSLVYDAQGRALRTTTKHNADGSTTIENKALASDGGLAEEHILTTSADGQTRTLSTDGNGDGVVDLIETDVTLANADGSMTRTVTEKTGGGALLSRIQTTTSADGRTISIKRDLDGGGTYTNFETIAVAANGARTDTTYDLTVGGTLVDKVVESFSASGQTRTTQTNIDGGANWDTTTTDTRTANTSAAAVLLFRLYDAVAGRGPDLGGFTTWFTALQTGTSLQSVEESFLNSTERAQKYGVQTDEQFVDQLYLDALNRAPTATEETNWLTALAAGTTRAQVVDAIIKSSEMGGLTASAAVAWLTADGGQYDTIIETNADGTARDKVYLWTSDDGRTKTSRFDFDANGSIDQATSAVVRNNADGSYETTTSVFNGNGSLRARTKTVLSSNNLTKSTYVDANGDNVWETMTLDSTVVNLDATTGKEISRSETTTDFNYGDNSVIDQTVVVKSVDGRSRTIDIDQNGDGHRDSNETIIVNAAGASVDTTTGYNANGAVIGKRVVSTSADGRTRTTQDYLDAGNVVDVTTTEVVTQNASDHSSTATLSIYNRNNTLRSQTITKTSADGLSITTQSDLDGNGIDVNTTDVTIIAADNSRTETVRQTNGASLRFKSVRATSADHKTVTTTIDVDGDGKTDRIEKVVTDTNGITTDNVSMFDPGGNLIDRSAATVNATGLVKTEAHDLDGDGAWDVTINDTTVLATNGSRTETITTNAGTALRTKTATQTSANGLTTTIWSDIDGNGVWNTTTTDVVLLNADGSHKETVTDTNENNSKRDQTITVTSDDGLSISTTIDLDGNGTIDRRRSDVTTLTSGSSRTETITDVAGARVNKTVLTTRIDFASKTLTIDNEGNGTIDRTEIDTRTVNSDGSSTESYTAYSGTTTAAIDERIVTNVDAFGLVTTITRSGANGYESLNSFVRDETTLQLDGSQTRTVTVSTANGGAVKSKELTTTTASGLSITTQTDVNGDGVFDATDAFVRSVDGSTLETRTNFTTDGNVREKAVLSSSSNGLNQTLQRDTDGDLIFDHTETKSRDAQGSTIFEIKDTTAGGALKAKVTTVTSADQLTQSVTVTPIGNDVIDLKRTRETILKADGTTTETISDYTAGWLRGRAVTTTSANERTKITTIDTNGDGSVDETQTDSTTTDTAGTTTRTLTTVYSATAGFLQKSIETLSANGLVKSISEFSSARSTADHTSSIVEASDGSTSRTDTYYDATGTQVSQTTSSTNFDGRVTTISTSGGLLETILREPDASGSYFWTLADTTVAHPSSNQLGLVNDFLKGYSSHTIDANGIDTWVWNESPTKVVSSTWQYDSTAAKSIKIDVATEQNYVAMAQRLYDTALDRNMTTKETQFLADYITSTGVFDKARLATDLVNSDYFTAKYGSLTNAQFVERVYQNAYGRYASLADLTKYVTQLASGSVSRATLLANVSESAEHIVEGNGQITTNNSVIDNVTVSADHIIDIQLATNIVRRLYAVGLGRNLSAADAATRAGQIVSGSYTEARIAAEIVNSGEFANKYGSTTNADFVSLLALNAFGRLPLPIEASSWLQMLNSGAISRGDLVDVIAQSVDRATTGAFNLTKIDVTGNGGTIHTSGLPITFEDGASGTVTSDNSTIYLKSNTHVTVTGRHTTVVVLGTGNTLNTNGNIVNTSSGAQVDVYGGDNTINGASNSTIGIYGPHDIIYLDNGTVRAANSWILLYGSHDIIYSNSSTIEVNGDYDVINGNYNTYSFNGDGDQVIGTGNTMPYDGGGGGYGFAGSSSVVSAAVGADIGWISRFDRAHGNFAGASVADSSLEQVQAAIASNLQSSVLNGAQWDKSTITWTISAPAGGNAALAEASAREAFADWSEATGLTFVEASDSSHSDISIGWTRFDTAASGIVGFTIDSRQNGGGVQIQLEDPFEDHFVFGTDGQATYDGTDATLTQVLLHEIGHTIGFADNANAGSIMSYYLGDANRALSDLDFAAAGSLYGGHTTT